MFNCAQDRAELVVVYIRAMADGSLNGTSELSSFVAPARSALKIKFGMLI